MDLKRSLNLVSAVVINRPSPLREFDQIYMKVADMLIQAEHVSRWVDQKDVVCIGDGDALGVCIAHLHRSGELTRGPRSVHVLDFDERMVNSVRRFASTFGYEGHVTSSLYNVADPLPADHRRRYTAFYTNPPFGGANGGASARAFIRRGMEATLEGAVGCIVVADDDTLPWCRQVLVSTQRFLLDGGFLIAELVPRMHTYHLDDNPNLTSCSLVAVRCEGLAGASGESLAIPADELANFYGRGAQLSVRYVRDMTNGRKLASRDHQLEPYTGAEGVAP